MRLGAAAMGVKSYELRPGEVHWLYVQADRALRVCEECKVPSGRPCAVWCPTQAHEED
jgi:hypothetical protein